MGLLATGFRVALFVNILSMLFRHYQAGPHQILIGYSACRCIVYHIELDGINESHHEALSGAHGACIIPAVHCHAGLAHSLFTGLAHEVANAVGDGEENLGHVH